ncbi:MAG TPA: DSD1 family PLP-dependent enzyme [Xanthobacteraceae bacterium]|nr:DSD1 family PLP-dependent enzyme [Xanthobacteraceae bacterium]
MLQPRTPDRKSMNPPPAEIGAAVAEIETPALVIDLDAFDRNVANMAAFARAAGVRVRPHAKTHKSAAVARRQIAAGAVGQCVQKVGEAEALVRGGVTDVLVSNEVIGERKLRRLAALARDARIALCFDAPEAVDTASRVARDFGVTLGGLVEIEVGMERCGIAPGRDAAALARHIADAPNLTFRGLQAYHGRAQHLPTYQERAQAIAFAIDAVNETQRALADEKLTCEIVGGAGTGTFAIEAASGVYNELQVGSYVFMDTDYARIGGKNGGRYDEFEHSLFVLSSVISAPAADRAIVDAGLKSYSAEKGPPWVHGRDDIEVTGVSDEHGKLKLGAAARRLRVGEQVWLIPGHCDPTVNLHDWYVGVRNGRVEALWPIDARGASI